VKTLFKAIKTEDGYRSTYWPMCVLCCECSHWIEFGVEDVIVEYNDPLYDSDDWVYVNTDEFVVLCPECKKKIDVAGCLRRNSIGCLGTGEDGLDAWLAKDMVRRLHPKETK
jgi:hypothetical protein